MPSIEMIVSTVQRFASAVRTTRSHCDTALHTSVFLLLTEFALSPLSLIGIFKVLV